MTGPGLWPGALRRHVTANSIVCRAAPNRMAFRHGDHTYIVRSKPNARVSAAAAPLTMINIVTGERNRDGSDYSKGKCEGIG